jgi:hypothetical protein
VRRRILIATVVLPLVVVLGLGFGWLLSGGTGDSAPRPVAVTTTSTLTPIARQIAADIHSGSRAKVTRAIAAPAGWKAPPSAVARFKALRSIDVIGNVVDNGDGTAQAVYRVVDAKGRSFDWQAMLIRSGGKWKLLFSKGA